MGSLKQFSVWGAIAFVLLLTACGGGASGKIPNKDNSSEGMESSEAVALYKKRCISCHGTELQGRAGPNLQKVGAKLSVEQIFDILSNGRKGMPKFEKSLSTEEIQSLAAWLAEHK
ncbi:c-type cytochrome [Bacillus sp. FJAT-28004]|uniref:c-type cytochrome n=1 Tax=Bacillus sp. FJAT-28004 TaxID=1679165 RepID=UPI0006B650D3|nr:cytochrome c [Bacillus sp. FJAT-28004]